MTVIGRELRSSLEQDGTLRLSLEEVALPDPGPDEVIVRVEAAPINPSDLLLMLGSADPEAARASGTPDRPTLSFELSETALAQMIGRVGQSLAAGNEGAGMVVAAGASLKTLEGRRVCVFGGGTFADYRKARALEVAPLPEGATSAQGAAAFGNPLTALGIVDTVKSEGHTALVHTAAASAVGQMVQKVCLKEGIPVVNIVRSQAQVDLLKGIGATYALNTTDPDFREQLLEAVAQTGATVAFDPIGGGRLGSTILEAMEGAAVRRMSEFSRYGSDSNKHLYIYGGLDMSPVILDRAGFGVCWNASGWLLTRFLQKLGAAGIHRAIDGVFDELTTTFATHYGRTIGLAEALDPQVMRAYAKRSTGEKYLIDPTRD